MCPAPRRRSSGGCSLEFFGRLERQLERAAGVPRYRRLQRASTYRTNAGWPLTAIVTVVVCAPMSRSARVAPARVALLRLVRVLQGQSADVNHHGACARVGDHGRERADGLAVRRNQQHVQRLCPVGCRRERLVVPVHVRKRKGYVLLRFPTNGFVEFAAGHGGQGDPLHDGRLAWKGHRHAGRAGSRRGRTGDAQPRRPPVRRSPTPSTTAPGGIGLGGKTCYPVALARWRQLHGLERAGADVETDQRVVWPETASSPRSCARGVASRLCREARRMPWLNQTIGSRQRNARRCARRAAKCAKTRRPTVRRASRDAP